MRDKRVRRPYNTLLTENRDPRYLRDIALAYMDENPHLTITAAAQVLGVKYHTLRALLNRPEGLRLPTERKLLHSLKGFIERHERAKDLLAGPDAKIKKALLLISNLIDDASLTDGTKVQNPEVSIEFKKCIKNYINYLDSYKKV